MIKIVLVVSSVAVMMALSYLLLLRLVKLIFYVNDFYVKPAYGYTIDNLVSPAMNVVDDKFRDNPVVASAIDNMLPYLFMLLLAVIFVKLRGFGFIARIVSYLYLYFISASLVVGAASHIYLVFFSFILIISIKGRVKAKYFYVFFISFVPSLFVDSSLPLVVLAGITAVLVITDYEVMKDKGGELATEKDFFFNAYLGKYRTLLNKSINSQDFNPA